MENRVNIDACITIAVFLELIHAHKKSLALQDTSSKVSASSANPVAGSDDLRKTVKKECSSGISYTTHTTATAAGTSQLLVSNSSAGCARNSHAKKILENMDVVATNSADDVAHGVLSGENESVVRTSSYLLCTRDIQSAKVSETQCETSRQTDGFRVPDIISALAGDMVNLYHSKVLSCNNSYVSASSGHSLPSAISDSVAKSRAGTSVTNVAGVQMADSSVVQPQRTVATKTPLVSKSPYKLVKAKTVTSSVCDESVLPPVLKSLQVTAHFDRSVHNIQGKRTRSSALTSRPCSASVSSVSCSSTMPKSLTVQKIPAVSSHLNTVSNSGSCATLSSLSSDMDVKSANPNASFTSSKYRLIRRRESACKNTSRQTFITPLKNSSVTRAVRHTPTLLVVNKYKLVRKKRRSLTLSAKRSPVDVKNVATPMKLSRDVSAPLCRNSSVSNVKTRSSRYKLVRTRDQPVSTCVRKPITQSAPNQAGDKVSKYKLVRRKSSAVLRTPQRATSTPADSSDHITQYTRSLSNRHVMPPFFLNKYKLIRKRALFKTSCSTSRSPHRPIYSRKPSAEGYKHMYSGKPHPVLQTSSPFRKRGTRKRSFLSKYALRRSGKGKRYLLFFCNVPSLPSCPESCFSI